MKKIIRKEKIKKYLNSTDGDRLSYVLTAIFLALGLSVGENHLLLAIILVPYLIYMGIYFYVNRNYLKNPTLVAKNV